MTRIVEEQPNADAVGVGRDAFQRKSGLAAKGAGGDHVIDEDLGAEQLVETEVQPPSPLSPTNGDDVCLETKARARIGGDEFGVRPRADPANKGPAYPALWSRQAEHRPRRQGQNRRAAQEQQHYPSEVAHSVNDHSAICTLDSVVSGSLR